VARVEVNLPSSTLLIGTTFVAVARAFDVNNDEISGASVAWQSSATNIVEVDKDGLLKGHALGNATITATIGGVQGTALITVVPLPVASIAVTPNGGGLDRGQTLQLSAVLRDQFGEILTGRQVLWASSAPGIAAVSSSGLVNALAAGTASITAMSEGLSATVIVNVIVTPAPGGPDITGVSPALLLPGTTAIITGLQFGAAPALNEVRVAGVLAEILDATETQLTVRLGASGYGCEPTREVFVQVARGNVADARLHPLQSVTLRNLQPGESMVFSSLADARCFELAPTGGKYAISVYSVATTVTAETSFRLRGALGLPIPAGEMPAVRAGEQRTAAGGQRTAGMAPAADLASLFEAATQRARNEAHGRLLEANLRLLSRVRPPIAPGPRASATASQVAVGTVLPFRIPNVGGFLTGGLDFCTSNFPVHARVVYNGTRAIVVEDTVTQFNGAATLAGQMDTLYQRVGEEFDQLMFGIVSGNFADPLRMDDLLDANGKVIMLFSPRINTFSGIAGFVVTCDFANPSTFPSSNRAEVFYATVPTDPAPGFAVNTRGNWFRTIRSTVVHEVKHIAAFANRIRDFNSALEEFWLEEGTARHAEELWARTAAYGGLLQDANATYASTLYCDVRPAAPSAPQCAGKPYAMFRHYGNGGLYDFLSDNELRSPLGPKLGAVDGSFYATAWSLVRWAIDTHGVSEAAFLGGLVRTSQSGVANLTTRLGRPWDEILGEWSLALLVDDALAAAPANARLTFPSWNLRSVFQGMSDDFALTQGQFTRPFPLIPRPVPYGDFTANVMRLAGGTFAMFQLSGTQTGRQLLDLRSLSGGDPHALLRVAIVRIE
jgi:hypothetical protein